ncbi:MAG: ATP-binding protein, partial [Dehalococcoidia bacterium]
MFRKPISELKKNDIDLLIKNEMIENRMLEYKQVLPGNKDQDKVECLADISSFANASGGYIIYGLADKKDTEGKSTGIPQYLGLGNVNFEQEKQRIENILLSGVVPRINGIHFKEVVGFDNGPIFIIYVPRSWGAPHMVKFKNCHRFYSRNSSGKYQLDIDEIRVAFAQSEALPERIREFRLQRISKLIEGDAPINLMQGLKYVLHIIPFESFKSVNIIDLSPFVLPIKEKLPLVHWGGQTHTRYNFEGVIASHMVGHDWNKKTYVYTQMFRNGIIEGLWMPYNPDIEEGIEKNICVEYED